MAEQFDVVVVGGGPGGYVAAIRASQLGMKVALVEREHLGGICLNWGCIPTKALLRTSELYHLMNHASDFGIKAEKISFDIKKIVERSRGVASQLSKGIGHLMKKNKITVFMGTAKLEGKAPRSSSGATAHTIRVDGEKKTELSAKHIILATGARARQLPGLEADGTLIWTYKEAMVPTGMPKSILVVGSGAIGIEFASFYRSLGADVTVVEVQDRILPVEDEEISKFAHKQFEKQGMKIITGAIVKELKKGKNEVTATIASPPPPPQAGGKASEGGKGGETSLTVDRVILAVGIVGNSENLGLENTKVKVEKGHIVTDGYGATAEPGIYAIGDVTGAPWLAHKASHEGIVCVEKIAGVKGVHPMKKENIPGCTYCHPQIASVGLTEKAAKEKYKDIKIGRFPFIGNGKAIALGETEGFIKTIFHAKTGELLGAHMIGAEVTEMIQGFVVAKTGELTEAELMHTIFPHPTLSEMMHESVLDAYGRVVHM